MMVDVGELEGERPELVWVEGTQSHNAIQTNKMRQKDPAKMKCGSPYKAKKEMATPTTLARSTSI